MEEASVVFVEDLPRGRQLETPLVTRPKRKRSWRRPREPVPAGDLQIDAGTSSEPSPAKPQEPISASEPSYGMGTSSAPSPEFVDCGGSAQSTPRRPNRSKVARRRPKTRTRRSLGAELEAVINQGSEEESGSDDDDIVSFMPVPRTARIVTETPIDDDSAAYHDKENVSDIDSGNNAEPVSPESPLMPRDFLDFVWKGFPESPIPPESRRETFSHSSGATTPLTDPYDLFVAIWDRKFMAHIVTETNRYAQQIVSQMIDNNNLHPRSRICEWTDTSVDELYVYFAIILGMGIVVKCRMEEYWNTAEDLFTTPGFRAHMTCSRFLLLNRLLHFNNNETLSRRNLNASEAKLFKVKPVLSHLNFKFSHMYNIKQNIALDESLLQWKGWLDINQFIPNKAAGVGIKSYELCESTSGYLWRFEIHSHKRTPIPQTSPVDHFSASTPAIVLRLLKGLEYRGHTVWMDNFYNSPALARKLKSLGFDCVGTLRRNRKFVPTSLSNLTKAQMKPGQIAGLTSGDVDLMVWRDQNLVATISTYHGNAVSAGHDGIIKPILIRDYNICMGGVDKKDQMLAAYPVERKRTKIWYKKLFRRLLNVSILNIYIIHKQSNAVPKLTHRNFRKQLILSLLQRHSSPPNSSIPTIPSPIHCPAEFPFLPNNKTRLRRRCVVCKFRTHTFCQECDKAVCLFKECFRTLHKPPYYKLPI